jgi:hypothetical protein
MDPILWTLFAVFVAFIIVVALAVKNAERR